MCQLDLQRAIYVWAVIIDHTQQHRVNYRCQGYLVIVREFDAQRRRLLSGQVLDERR